MKNIFKFLLLFICLFSSITKTNAQIRINDFTDARIYLDGIFKKSKVDLDEYGNLSIDMGSAEKGRYGFRIIDVDIDIERKLGTFEECKGKDCPPRIVVKFECKKSDCIYNPKQWTREKFGQASLKFTDEKIGVRAYEFFKELQVYIRNTI